MVGLFSYVWEVMNNNIYYRLYKDRLCNCNIRTKKYNIQRKYIHEYICV